MAVDGAADGREESLRPTRWPGRPGGATLLRVGLVAALLGLAAAVLYAPPPCAPSAVPPAVAVSAVPETTADPAHPVGNGAPDRPLPLPSGAVGVPIRLAEPAALAVVRPGTRVDLLAVPAGRVATEASLLAAGALVLDVVGGEVVGGDAWGGSSALYLALRPDQARRAVGLPEGSRFAIVVRG